LGQFFWSLAEGVQKRLKFKAFRDLLALIFVQREPDGNGP
jgi:hypothetical protein